MGIFKIISSIARPTPQIIRSTVPPVIKPAKKIIKTTKPVVNKTTVIPTQTQPVKITPEIKKVEKQNLGYNVQKSVAVSEFGGNLRNFKPTFGGSGQINLQNAILIRPDPKISDKVAKNIGNNVQLRVLSGDVDRMTQGSVQQFVRQNDLKNIDVGGIPLGKVSKLSSPTNVREFKKNDMLFSRVGTIGKVRQFDVDTKIFPIYGEPTGKRGTFGYSKTNSFDDTALEVEKASFGFPDLDDSMIRSSLPLYDESQGMRTLMPFADLGFTDIRSKGATTSKLVSGGRLDKGVDKVTTDLIRDTWKENVKKYGYRSASKETREQLAEKGIYVTVRGVENALKDVRKDWRNIFKTGGIGEGKGRGFQTQRIENFAEKQEKLKLATNEYINKRVQGVPTELQLIADKYQLRMDDIRTELAMMKLRHGIPRGRMDYGQAKTLAEKENVPRQYYREPTRLEKLKSLPLTSSRRIKISQLELGKKQFNIVQNMKAKDATVDYLKAIADDKPIRRKTFANNYGVHEKTLQVKLKELKRQVGITTKSTKGLTKNEAYIILKNLPDDYITAKPSVMKQGGFFLTDYDKPEIPLFVTGFLKDNGKLISKKYMINKSDQIRAGKYLTRPSELGVQNTASTGRNIISNNSPVESINLGYGTPKVRMDRAVVRSDSDIVDVGMGMPFSEKQNKETRAIFDSMSNTQREKLIGQSSFDPRSWNINKNKIEPKKYRKSSDGGRTKIMAKKSSDYYDKGNFARAGGGTYESFMFGEGTIMGAFDKVFDKRLTAVPNVLMDTTKIKPMVGVFGVYGDGMKMKGKLFRKMNAKELDEVKEGTSFDKIRIQQRQEIKNDKLKSGLEQGMSGFRNIFSDEKELYLTARQGKKKSNYGIELNFMNDYSTGFAEPSYMMKLNPVDISIRDTGAIGAGFRDILGSAKKIHDKRKQRTNWEFLGDTDELF